MTNSINDTIFINCYYFVGNTLHKAFMYNAL